MHQLRVEIEQSEKKKMKDLLHFLIEILSCVKVRQDNTIFFFFIKLSNVDPIEQTFHLCKTYVLNFIKELYICFVRSSGNYVRDYSSNEKRNMKKPFIHIGRFLKVEKNPCRISALLVVIIDI